MSVSTIGSAASIPPQGGHHHRHGGMKKAEEAAAQALGMSASDLSTALQGGQTIAQLAQTKGVSLDSVTSAVSSALSGVGAAQAQEIASRFVQGPSAGGPPPQLKDAFDAAAKTLGLSSDELKSQLDNGQTLASIAKGKQVDVATVASAMAKALQGDDSTLTDGDAATEAQQLMQGPPAHQSGVLATALGSVAASIGVDPDQLGNDLMSGESLTQIASSAGVSSDTLIKDFASSLQQADSGLSSDDATSIASQLVGLTVGSGKAVPAYTAGGVVDASVLGTA